MGTERRALNRLIVVKPYRKSGNGAMGSKRKGNSGKKGSIFQIESDGSQKLLASAQEGTFKELTRVLRASGFIPSHVSINSSGETRY